MFKRLILFSSLLLLLFATACGGGSESASPSNSNTDEGNGNQEATYNFTYAHAGATTHTTHLAAQKFADLVEEKSNGRIQITIYPNRQLGDEREIMENVINGTIDMASNSTPILTTVAPALEVLQLPFLLNTYDIEQQAYQTDAMKQLLDSVGQSIGVKLMGPHDLGMRHIANNVREVKTPEDLSGLKLRTVQSPIMTDIFQTLGASPTPMAYGEVYTALQTGTIDGEEINLTSIVAEKHLEVLKYVTLTGQFPFPAVVLINEAKYNQLSDADKQILEEAAAEMQAFMFEEIKKIDADALEQIKAANVQVTELTEEELEAFIRKTEPLVEKYMAKDPLIADFVNAVRELKGQ